MKECQKCSLLRDSAEYKKTSALPHACILCNREHQKKVYSRNKAYHKKYYHQNKSKIISKNRERHKIKSRQLIILYLKKKSESGCAKCGFSDGRALDYHHVDPKTKDGSVSEMIGWAYSIEKIDAEIEKCIVLCSNCHRIEHFIETSEKLKSD